MINFFAISTRTKQRQTGQSAQLLSTSLIDTGGWGPIPGLVKLDTKSPTARHRCNIFLELSFFLFFLLFWLQILWIDSSLNNRLKARFWASHRFCGVAFYFILCLSDQFCTFSWRRNNKQTNKQALSRVDGPPATRYMLRCNTASIIKVRFLINNDKIFLPQITFIFEIHCIFQMNIRHFWFHSSLRKIKSEIKSTENQQTLTVSADDAENYLDKQWRSKNL